MTVVMILRVLTRLKPLIEANWGDYVEVIVNIQISGPEEGTTINW